MGSSSFCSSYTHAVSAYLCDDNDCTAQKATKAESAKDCEGWQSMTDNRIYGQTPLYILEQKAELDKFILNSDKRIANWSAAQREAAAEAVKRCFGK